MELTYAEGEQTLPQLTEALGVDLRVDAFTEEGVSEDSERVRRYRGVCL